MAIKLNTRGIDKVTKNLEKKYGKSILEEAQKSLARTALIDVETYAKEKLTKDEHVLTGRLRSSIHTETSDNIGYKYSDTKGGKFDGSLSEKPRNKNNVKVGTNVIYAQRIERLDPYMRTAYMNGKKKVKTNLLNDIKRVI